MAPSREQLLQTTNLFIEGFNEFTPESVLRVRSPNCTHRMVPATMKSEPTTSDKFAEFVGLLGPVMPKFEMRIVEGEEPVVDEVAGKVTIHAKSKSETPIGLYENEYVWVLTMSEDGKKIVDVLEFLDSLYTSEWIPKLIEATKAAKK